MSPYGTRKKREPDRKRLEAVTVVVAMAILIACGVWDLLRLSQTTHANQTKEREQNTQSTARLEARNSAVEVDLAVMARLLQTSRSDLAELTAGQDVLGRQVTTMAAQLKQFEAAIQQAGERTDQLG